ncbi:hypothetical protein ACIBJC_15325 [Streptomyces sp. NPDC050509]|uniref:hypothetical protein n=1 Tax=Streptomyces sp. NPDC050509 TaxID=3365620 RepID=UPI0037A1FECD
MAWLAGQRITAQRLRDETQNTVNYSAITANTATTTAAEVIGMTTTPVTFRSGRAYRVTYKGAMASSTAGQQGTMAVRKGTVTGMTFVNGFRLYLPANGTVAFVFSGISSNTTGSDITTTLVGTYGLTVQVTSGTVNLGASPSNPAYIHVEDIGPSGDYTGVTAIV